MVILLMLKGAGALTIAEHALNVVCDAGTPIALARSGRLDILVRIGIRVMPLGRSTTRGDGDVDE